jgi:hypothetical protein
VLRNLSIDMESLGRESESRLLHAEVVLRHQRSFGQQHPLTGATRANVRAWYEARYDG